MNEFVTQPVLLGPYIGDFRTEIEQFLPYANWISTIFPNSKIYINSHYNREFLYKNLIPVFSNLTRTELDQKHVMHKQVSIKEYSICVKYFKESIPNLKKKSVYIYNMQYSSRNNKISNFQKLFKPFVNITQKNDNIIYIPDNIANIKHIELIYKFLKDNYFNVICLGDMKTFLQEENELLKNPNYFNIVYEYIIQEMVNAKAIICPAGVWTLIANLHNLNVFSWGKSSNTYKSLYNFNNKNSLILQTNKDMGINIIINQLKYFMEKIGE